MSKPFQFKEFTVQQDQCAMKIGTDGVLLGAWAEVGEYPKNILDIGTGTGVVALMLAQRSDAPTIDAIELDKDAYFQSQENFQNSPWADRLFGYHAEFTEYVAELFEEEETYDVIVSNPPFYAEDYSSGDAQRDAARLNASLPFEDLIEGASLILSEKGIFNLIVPFKEQDTCIGLAAQFGMYLIKITQVKGNPDAEVKRSLLAFSFQQPTDVDASLLIIEKARHQYTQEYIELTKDFYLKM